MGHRWKVATVRGIPLYVSTSWVWIAALYVWSQYTDLTLRRGVRAGTAEALLLAILAAGLLTFALSFDDFVLSFFTTGEAVQPLPVRIYSAIRFGVTPVINAIGALMLLVSVSTIVLALALPWLLGRRGQTVLIGKDAI